MVVFPCKTGLGHQSKKAQNKGQPRVHNKTLFQNKANNMHLNFIKNPGIQLCGIVSTKIFSLSIVTVSINMVTTSTWKGNLMKRKILGNNNKNFSYDKTRDNHYLFLLFWDHLALLSMLVWNLYPQSSLPLSGLSPKITGMPPSYLALPQEVYNSPGLIQHALWQRMGR